MSISPFAAAERAPADANVALTEAFRNDPRPHKINLGVGTYADAHGRVPLLRSVQMAEARLVAERLPRDYQPVPGTPEFNAAIQLLVFGAATAPAPQTFVTVQTLGGTGALRVGAELLRRLHPESTVYVSQPSWVNHRPIFEAAGLCVADYPYYSPQTAGVDFDRMLDFLARAAAHSIVVLHACCHNPTGADLTPTQWCALAQMLRARRLIAFIDLAYQGFGAGPDEDAHPVRLFASLGLNFLVATSLSKSFALYGERVGALSIAAAGADEADSTLSMLKRIVRTSYSYPPIHGGALVRGVLTDASLRALWLHELDAMRQRIVHTRRAFVQALRDLNCPLNVAALASQRGMFSYTGLSMAQVEILRRRHAIYAPDSGRICIAALNTANLGQVALALDASARSVHTPSDRVSA